MLRTIKETPSIDINELHRIATEYLAAYPSPSLKHDNQEYAQRLNALTEGSSAIEQWHIVLGVYGQLKSGSLQSELKKFIETAYGFDAREVNYAFTFQRGIAAPWVYNIGLQYLQQYPDRNIGFMASHTNQPSAKFLMDNARKFQGSRSWIYLYLMYRDHLPNHRGALAANIRQLFCNHFHDSFDNIVAILELGNYDEKKLISMPDSALDLGLSEELEERMYREQVQAMFNKKSPQLGVFEEASVFWYKRQAYVRLMAAGVIIIAPVAAVLFLTANIYALIFMGIIAGGGTLVLEMVGHTAIKVEQIPDDVWDLMGKNQAELGVSIMKLKTQMNRGEQQIQLRDLQIQKQETLIGSQKSAIEAHQATNSEQKTQIETLEKNVLLLSKMTTGFTENLLESKAQQTQWVQNLEAACSTNASIAAQGMANLTNLAMENKRLAANNVKLESQVKRMDQLIEQLQKIAQLTSTGAAHQEQTILLLSNLAQQAGLIHGSVHDAKALLQASHQLPHSCAQEYQKEFAI